MPTILQGLPASIGAHLARLETVAALNAGLDGSGLETAIDHELLAGAIGRLVRGKEQRC